MHLIYCTSPGAQSVQYQLCPGLYLIVLSSPSDTSSSVASFWPLSCVTSVIVVATVLLAIVLLKINRDSHGGEIPVEVAMEAKKQSDVFVCVRSNP